MANDHSEKQPDEAVNGAQAAARIIARFESAQRSRTLKAMAQRDPQITIEVTEHLVTLNSFANLPAKQSSEFLSRVTPQELVVTLAEMPVADRDAMLAQIPPAARTRLEEQISALEKIPSNEIQQTKAHALEVLEGVASAQPSGRIRRVVV